MKKKQLIIAVIAVVLTAVFVFLWRDYQKTRQEEKEKEALKASSGCHIVDDKLYAHFSGVCYVFDDKTDQLVMETAVVLDGEETEEDAFSGTLSVLDYQHSEEGILSGTPIVEKREGGFYTVHDLQTCRHNEPDEDGLSNWVEHFTDYEFTYYVYPEDPQFLAVLIYEHLEDDYYVGILAETEAEAKETYQWFKENEP